ncbi:hypothetical protein C662_10681 [Thauera sp. 28]|uniref:PEP-CTERM sorting domain-containing protein n=1 Tax=unclassified Thauera TaxID=2609274 RepID=UPI0002CEF1EA|nr:MULTISPECIES: PEP-CTERM sorting domain-containing protein [unclassified Thauera]ENO79636.1 hypothetical protein B447_12969 [Thauera sp. 27]ENO92813.1 hypothetical protein C662_10681 [Thauera sp. 28]
MLKKLAIALTASIALASSANAAVINTFSNLAAFSAAAGTTALEDFNDSALGRFSYGVAYDFDGFTLTAAANPRGTGPGVGIGNTARSTIDNTARLIWGSQTFGANGSGWGPQIEFIFDAPTYAFGFDWRDTDSTDSYKLTVLGVDFGGATTGGLFPRNGTSTSGFFGLVSDTAFSSVLLQQVARGGVLDDMSIDNVRFTPAPASAVPEPTVLALLSLGLLGLGAVRRKQRTA